MREPEQNGANQSKPEHIHRSLDHVIGVQIPASQPFASPASSSRSWRRSVENGPGRADSGSAAETRMRHGDEGTAAGPDPGRRAGWRTPELAASAVAVTCILMAAQWSFASNRPGSLHWTVRCSWTMPAALSSTSSRAVKAANWFLDSLQGDVSKDVLHSSRSRPWKMSRGSRC
jgi:hypothetical protein